MLPLGDRPLRHRCGNAAQAELSVLRPSSVPIEAEVKKVGVHGGVFASLLCEGPKRANTRQQHEYEMGDS